MVTSDNGTLLGTIKYYPYGECRNSTGDLGTDRLFTGQRLDDTGLYYYGARYYDPLIGRFVSADTIVPNPMNPQSLNRYSYCLNNPLKYIDPSGHGVGDLDAPTDEGQLGWSEDQWYESQGGQWVPMINEVVDALIDIYAGSPAATWSGFLGEVGLLGSPARDWGVGSMLADALLHGENTKAGILAGVLSGGTARLSPGGSALIYENIDRTSPTGELMNFLDAGAFTLGHVILSTAPRISSADLRHEFGHIVQYDILGGAFLGAYGFFSFTATLQGFFDNYVLGMALYRPIDDPIHTYNPMENIFLPSWQWWIK